MSTNPNAELRAALEDVATWAPKLHKLITATGSLTLDYSEVPALQDEYVKRTSAYWKWLYGLLSFGYRANLVFVLARVIATDEFLMLIEGAARQVAMAAAGERIQGIESELAARERNLTVKENDLSARIAETMRLQGQAIEFLTAEHALRMELAEVTQSTSACEDSWRACLTPGKPARAHHDGRRATNPAPLSYDRTTVLYAPCLIVCYDVAEGHK